MATHKGSCHCGRVAFEVDTVQLGGVLEVLTGLGVRTLTSQPPTLEELFLRHYGDEVETEEQQA